MGRPKPVVYLEKTNSKNFKSEQIIKSEGIYAVFYDGKPINIRIVNSLSDYPGPKYKKSSFPNVGHCINLAERLNTQYKTDKFKVFKMATWVEFKE